MDVVMCHKFAEAITVFLNQYGWLLDSYVIEFFSEDHWGKLPLCWQEALSVADPKQLGHILLNQSERCHNSYGGVTSQDDTCKSVDQVYPLSLLAFAATAKALSLPRHPSSSLSFPNQQQPETTSYDFHHSCSQVAGIEHRYRRHVKPKKQHEIKCLAEVVSKVAQETKCQNIIDVGSGQGHLARFLAYNYGLDVTAIEAVGEHLTAAAKFDGEIEKDKAKQSERRKRKDGSSEAAGGEDLKEPLRGTVRHVQSVIKPGCTITEFLSQAGLTPPTLSIEAMPTLSTAATTTSSSAQECSKKEEGGVNKHHILVGLHTCGDLGATMMKVFRESETITGLVSLGCCYMKLSTQEDNKGCSDQPSSSTEALGYPLSEFVCSLLPSSSLSYEAREVACHSIDSYSKQLQQAGEGDLTLDHLKIHCHRAAVETVLRKNGMKRAQVRTSRRVSKLPFPEYAQSLVRSVGLPPLGDEEMRALSLLVKEGWRKVAMFFMLRLAMAPCVESLMLLDRAILLAEQNTTARCSSHTHKHVQVQLIPIFNPNISPRNIALIAKR